VGSADGETLLALNPERHGPTRQYMQRLRQDLPAQFPSVMFFFQPADIVNQILNFGLPAPINVRVAGVNQDATYPMAQNLQARLARIRGLADVHVHQIVHAPALHVEVDRTRAAELGLTQRDIANNLLVTLSGNRFVSPNFWADPRTGIPYPLVVQTPQYRIDSLESMRNTSMAVNGAAVPQLLSNLATFERRAVPSVVTHANVQPVFDIYANVLENTFNAVPPLVEHHNSQLYGEVLPAKIIEWKLPGSIYPHDTIYRPTDRRFYTVDQGNDAIYITDPLLGTTETYTLPKSAAPSGGDQLGLQAHSAGDPRRSKIGARARSDRR